MGEGLNKGTRAEGSNEAMAASTTSYVALLRGINVGGKHKVPMAELRELCESLGCRDVRTYIQSGNLVFAANKADAGKLPERLAASIEEQFGFAVPVVLRSKAQWQRVAAAHPFIERAVEDRFLHVAFLSAKPKAADVRKLDPERSPPDEFVVDGSTIYSYLELGARSKLTIDYYERVLSVTATARNWRTVQTIDGMLRE